MFCWLIQDWDNPTSDNPILPVTYSVRILVKIEKNMVGCVIRTCKECSVMGRWSAFLWDLFRWKIMWSIYLYTIYLKIDKRWEVELQVSYYLLSVICIITVTQALSFIMLLLTHTMNRFANCHCSRWEAARENIRGFSPSLVFHSVLNAVPV